MLLSTAATCLFAPIAQAQEWFFLTANEYGDRIFVDRSSISRRADTAQIQTFLTFAETKEDGATAAVFFTEYACDRPRYRDLEITVLYDDQSIRTTSTPSDWEAVNAETVNEIIARAACGEAGKV